MGGLEFVGLELLAVFPIHDPLAGGFQTLACRNRSRTAHDRHQVLAALDLHLEDGETILRVVVGDSFDEAGQGFGHGDDDVRFLLFYRRGRAINPQCLGQLTSNLPGNSL